MGPATDLAARLVGRADRRGLYVHSGNTSVFRAPEARPSVSLDICFVWSLHHRLRRNPCDGNLDSVARSLLDIRRTERDNGDYIRFDGDPFGENCSGGTGAA